MPRAKRGFKARRRRNRVLKHAQGFHLSRGRQFGDAVEQVRHAWAAAYRSRRQRRRDYRRLWIARINAGARQIGFSYSKLIGKLKSAGVELDRKVLADIALQDPAGFKAIAESLK
ncbi:MAG TPA: 50S ribosomal protein L20 [Polyangiales bacterium]|nr:50S ribosomal protein L20 [Polyangiales bacterium]